jgi:phosphatidylinositol alpha-mannosyltransferase
MTAHPVVPQPELDTVLADGGPPLRIALVSEYYYPHFGGVTEHVHFLRRELCERGHHVDIITSHLGEAPDEPGLFRLGRSQRVFANGSEARLTFGVSRRQLRKLFAEQRYDLIHAHSPLAPTLPLFAVEAAEVPVIGTVHTNFGRSLLYTLLNRRVQKVADRLAATIAVSPTAAAAHDRYFDINWHIIPNGVDLNQFRRGLEPPEAMRGHGPYILFLGRLDPRNGLSELITAFQLVSERLPDARLIVVGDGPRRSHYRRQAADNPAIRFEGAVKDERGSYYANCTVYACPTTKASFGITLLEAMACGAPIVCSNIEGFTDVVRDGHDCLMTELGDPHALAVGLLKVLGDAALRRRLADNGHQTVQRYAWPIVTDQVLALYREVLAGRGLPRTAPR